MLLTNTKLTGYSLGLPLWWPDQPENLSTGWLQGLNLTLSGTPEDVYLTRYYREGSNVKLTFSTKTELLCILDVDLPEGANTYKLEKASENFVDGYVTLYRGSDNAEADLSGARVCPKYINFVKDKNNGVKKFTIASMTADRKVSYTTIALKNMQLVDSPSISVSIENKVATLFPYEEITITEDFDELLYTINNIKATGGTFTLTLPTGWKVRKVGISYAEIGVSDHFNSCPTADYIDDKLNPSNFLQNCPLTLAFDTETQRHFDMKSIVCTRFNPEYEYDAVTGERGLAWNEFSHLHDEF